MILYIVTLWQPDSLRDRIIKVFSTKQNLDKWMECAKHMDRELFGDLQRDITHNYKIQETELDNLDFVNLLTEARDLGAKTKPSDI